MEDDHPLLITPTRNAVKELQSSSLSNLVAGNTPKSTNTVPHFKPYPVSPFRNRHLALLEKIPKTEFEQELQDALRESENRDSCRKQVMVETLATSVLQDVYVREVKAHLEQYEKKSQKKRNKNRIFGDGLPKLMTDDVFYNNVVAVETVVAREKRAKEERRVINAKHSEALKMWKRADEERVARNKVVRADYRQAIKEWTEEDAVAKREGRKMQRTKPKQGLLEKFVPRPKKPEAERETNGDSGDEEDDDDDEDDDADEIVD
ncbi:hypothetical protein BDQ17DRAFT_1236928 [Cyathus striatus]|nr:hypothetical protein BDQ17DRAFT_1236928 [Cyathus striatus]